MADVENSGDDPRFAEVKSKVTNWLLKDWSVKQIANEQTAWAIAVKDNGRQVLVAQPNQRPDVLLIQAQLRISEDHRAQMRGLDPSDRRELLWDIRFQLLGMGVEFTGLIDDPEHIILKKVLFWDGVTRNDLASAMQQVLSANLAVIWMVQRKFGQPGEAALDIGGGHIN